MIDVHTWNFLLSPHCKTITQFVTVKDALPRKGSEEIRAWKAVEYGQHWSPALIELRHAAQSSLSYKTVAARRMSQTIAHNWNSNIGKLVVPRLLWIVKMKNRSHSWSRAFSLCSRFPETVKDPPSEQIIAAVYGWVLVIVPSFSPLWLKVPFDVLST